MIGGWSLVSENITKTNNNERDRLRRHGDLLGIVIWVFWALVITILIHTQINSDETNRYYSSQIFSWLIFGPLIVFMFVGRLMFSNGSDDLSKSLMNKKNFAISLASFIGWALLVEILVVSNITIYTMLILAGGWIIALILLTLNNKSWRF
jgi:hypothetical protein